MTDIAEYFTVVSSDPDGLDHAVSRAIEDGYEPFGQPYVSAAHEVDVLYHQAMVRRPTRSLFADAGNPLVERAQISDTRRHLAG